MHINSDSAADASRIFWAGGTIFSHLLLASPITDLQSCTSICHSTTVHTLLSFTVNASTLETLSINNFVTHKTLNSCTDFHHIREPLCMDPLSEDDANSFFDSVADDVIIIWTIIPVGQQ